MDFLMMTEETLAKAAAKYWDTSHAIPLWNFLPPDLRKKQCDSILAAINSAIDSHKELMRSTMPFKPRQNDPGNSQFNFREAWGEKSITPTERVHMHKVRPFLPPYIKIVEKLPGNIVHILEYPNEKTVRQAYTNAVKSWKTSGGNTVQFESDEKIIALSSDIVASVTVYIRGRVDEKAN